MIQFRNSLTGKSEPFVPLKQERVTLYVCGPTVYDFIHIGNARPLVVFDTLFRLLKRKYKDVCYVRNITDIDDKIINRAIHQKLPASEVAKKYIEHYHQDIASLNVCVPSVEPKATEHIPQMIDLIKRLIENGHAYEAEGHVLFSVQSSESYGKLSHRSLDQMIAGSRVEIADYKNHPYDFVLWKPSSEDQPSWDSPWGKGRPGWHIECSAMAVHYLGETIDIHGGGQDLLFPHHENERIQSCCAYGNAEFANYWLHNGYVLLSGEKMSKSVGNVQILRELLRQFPGEVLRMALLGKHYRKPLDWNVELIENVHQALSRYYDAFRRYGFDPVVESGIKENDLIAPVVDAMQRVEDALCDDLNTPLALTEMQHMLSQVHTVADEVREHWLVGLSVVGHWLGLFNQHTNQWFDQSSDDLDIEKCISQREEARRNKEFKKADEIRQYLLDQGVVIEDEKSGTTWFRRK